MPDVPPALALLAPSVATAGIVTATVEGSGTVSATVAGISGAVVCPPDCERFVPDGTTIEVSALPERGASFLGWGGACAPASGSACALTVMGDLGLTARFTAAPPPPPPTPVLERQRLPFLEEVTLAGSAPECVRPRFGSCDERLLGVLRDGRLLLLRGVGGDVSTVRVVGRSGLGARTIGRVRVGDLSPYSARLSTDRRVVLWEGSFRINHRVVGLSVPSGRRVAYPPARTAAVYPYSDFDRRAGVCSSAPRWGRGACGRPCSWGAPDPVPDAASPRRGAASGHGCHRMGAGSRTSSADASSSDPSGAGPRAP